VDKTAMQKLLEYHWPGNVRELQNITKRACIFCKGTHILPEELVFYEEYPKKEEDVEQILDNLFERLIRIYKEEDIISIVEKEFIKRALKLTKANQIKAAKILGMNRNTLRNKIEKYKIKIDNKKTFLDYCCNLYTAPL